jgi:hypothetical protein
MAVMRTIFKTWRTNLRRYHKLPYTYADTSINYLKEYVQVLISSDRAASKALVIAINESPTICQTFVGLHGCHELNIVPPVLRQQWQQAVCDKIVTALIAMREQLIARGIAPLDESKIQRVPKPDSINEY